jgi:hypothetical protein
VVVLVSPGKWVSRLRILKYWAQGVPTVCGTTDDHHEAFLRRHDGVLPINSSDGVWTIAADTGSPVSVGDCQGLANLLKQCYLAKCDEETTSL